MMGDTCRLIMAMTRRSGKKSTSGEEWWSKMVAESGADERRLLDLMDHCRPAWSMVGQSRGIYHRPTGADLGEHMAMSVKLW